MEGYASETMANSHNRHTDIDLSCRLWTKVAVLFCALCGFFGRSHGILWHNCSPPASLRLLDKLFLDVSAVCCPIHKTDFVSSGHHSAVGPRPHDFIHAGSFFIQAGIDGRAWQGGTWTHLRVTAAALLVLIDLRPGGQGWIFFLLAVIFASDTGAFYCGKLLGKHKLYEAVSPKKTWEGAIGGVIVSVIAASIFLRLIALHPLDLSIGILVIALSAAGQIGDLSQSMLKRTHGVKDSGHILPGHGGILDRIDGLLFAIPVLFVYLFFYTV